MTGSVDVIIVNWNAGRLLHRCLESVIAARHEDLRLQRVVVVDNASTDGSMHGVEGLAPFVKIIPNASNTGFAAACNQGARGSIADYVLFLNPDTEVLTDGLVQPLAFLDRPENGDVGIVGIQLVDDAGRVARTCARFPTTGRICATMLGLDRVLPSVFPPHFMLEWDHGDSREVDQVMGAFFLVRRALFETLGGFDERFFVYFEEVDLSLRARLMGWRTVYLSTARAVHFGSGQGRRPAQATRLFYSLRSRLFYAHKHFSRSSAAILTLSTLILEPFARIALAIAARSPGRFGDTLKAYGLLWRAISHDLVGRRRDVG